VKNQSAKEERVVQLLEQVGLSSQLLYRYPHEFSGGQRQRIAIARAIALQPSLLVCDEAVSALDVSIQAQVLNLLSDLKDEFGLTYLFIAHGLKVVKHISDRVGVMYLGKLMEVAEKHELYKNPLNPYTQALLSAIPVTDVNHKKERIILKGDVPSPINPGDGCRFYSRCFKAFKGCDEICPELKDVTSNNGADANESCVHSVACRLFA
jgi:peptide/nickel transport system ATP-binding protein